jgi:hypothetical protein
MPEAETAYVRKTFFCANPLCNSQDSFVIEVDKSRELFEGVGNYRCSGCNGLTVVFYRYENGEIIIESTYFVDETV